MTRTMMTLVLGLAMCCSMVVHGLERAAAAETDVSLGAAKPPLDMDPDVRCLGWRRCPASVIQPNGVVSLTSLKASCKAIKTSDSNAPSGEYYIRTFSSRSVVKVVKVYCEMGLNGGGYTFLHPTSLTELTDAEVQAIFTDRRSFLMRYRENNGRQSFSVLQQLIQYSSTNLKLGLNQNTGYNNPVNKNAAYLGKNYLYFGFLPVSIAASNTVQGLRVNGNAVTFRNCDRNPNSHITLFPNFAEKAPSTYGNGFGAYGTVCNNIANHRQPNPSSRAMPVDYFMFTELHWGGCGCYGSTDHRSNTILATTIGFR